MKTTSLLLLDWLLFLLLSSSDVSWRKSGDKLLDTLADTRSEVVDDADIRAKGFLRKLLEGEPENYENRSNKSHVTRCRNITALSYIALIGNRN